MQRRAVFQQGLAWVVAGSAAVCSRAAIAPRQRLGVLLFDNAAAWDFLQRDLPPALARLGWVEGRNLVIDWRFADGDAARLPGLAQALVRDGATVLMTRGTPVTRVLQQAAPQKPIVTGVGDPLGAGFAGSLAAPGGNVTGLSYGAVEQTEKQLELLRELVPAARRLLILMPASRGDSAPELARPVERVAARLGLSTARVLAIRAEDLRREAAAERRRQPPGTLVAFAFSFGRAADLALAAQRERVPTVFDQRAFVEAGGLASYQLLWDDQTARIAAQLDKVLRGTPPAQVPFELPTRSELALNAAAARELGLTLTPALRARADAIVD